MFRYVFLFVFNLFFFTSYSLNASDKLLEGQDSNENYYNILKNYYEQSREVANKSDFDMDGYIGGLQCSFVLDSAKGKFRDIEFKRKEKVTYQNENGEGPLFSKKKIVLDVVVAFNHLSLSHISNRTLKNDFLVQYTGDNGTIIQSFFRKKNEYLFFRGLVSGPDQKDETTHGYCWRKKNENNTNHVN